MALGLDLLGYVTVFLAMVTVITFVHEFGHFLAARACGVRVEVFAVGFGRELAGWTDRCGTRWRLALLPLGGYVKMFAEDGVARDPDGGDRALTAAEARVSYSRQPILARAAIVAAGPLANLLFAVLAIAAAMFVLRSGAEPVGPVEALLLGAGKTVAYAVDSVGEFARLAAGQGSAADLAGPIRLAQIGGDGLARFGIGALVLLTALLSINIGLVNLLPVPMLDGGHLLFLAVEALRGRPLSRRVQRMSALCGLTAVLALSLVVTLNDLVRL